jgi:hypothetical protein
MSDVFIFLVIYMVLCAGAAALFAPSGRKGDFFAVTLVLLGPLGVVAALIVDALDRQRQATTGQKSAAN